MKKAQKITIAITLLIMAFILICPPVGEMLTGEGVKYVYTSGRNLVFAISSRDQINVTNLAVELMAAVFIGAAFVVLFGLKKKP